jgi:hypothetical protein
VNAQEGLAHRGSQPRSKLIKRDTENRLTPPPFFRTFARLG